MAGRRNPALAKHRQTGGSRRRAAAVPATIPNPSGLPMLRTSERSTMKSCEWRWDLEYNQLLKPHVSMPALRFGTLIHQALAAYYIPGRKRGQNPADAFELFYHKEQAYVQEKFGFKDEEGTWVNALELGIAMMNNYLDEYGSDDRWEVLVTEQPFQVIVPKPDGTPWFLYVGVMDGVWRDLRTKQLWIPDHKSTDGIGDKKFTHLVLDDQAGSYWSFGVDWLVANELLKRNQKLNGMLYNFLRKSTPDERQSKIIRGKRVYLNLDGTPSKKQPSPYFLRLPIFRDEYDKNQVRLRATVDYARIERFRSGDLPITKTPGMFTCPSCWARDACELHETGADYESFLRETTRQWDPYDSHEVYHGR